MSLLKVKLYFDNNLWCFKNWIVFDPKEVFPGPLTGGSLSKVLNLGQSRFWVGYPGYGDHILI